MIDGLSFTDFLAGAWKTYRFEPFKQGVEICWLHRQEDGSAAALLRYQPGAKVPRHRHSGMETILVLDGSQSDCAGTHETGTLVINPAGSVHAVRSEAGCVVLIIWAQPVEFIETD